MPKERTTISIIQWQKKQLQKRSEEEHLPLAELIRRAIAASLAWDDPGYAPHPEPPQTSKGHSSRLKSAGLSGPTLVRLSYLLTFS